jgi:transposase
VDDDDTADRYRGRWPRRPDVAAAQRDAVLRLLRGDDLDMASRPLGVAAATLSGWRDALLDGGETSLAPKPTNGEKRESDRLKARLSEISLERDLLEQKIAQVQGNSGPLARRKSRR